MAGPWGEDKMSLSGNTGGPWPNSEWGPKSKNSWGDCSNNDMDPNSWGQKNIVCYFNLFVYSYLILNVKMIFFRDKKIKIKIIFGKVKHTEFLLKWESRYKIFI